MMFILMLFVIPCCRYSYFSHGAPLYNFSDLFMEQLLFLCAF